MAAARGTLRAFMSSAWITAELLIRRQLGLPKRLVGDHLVFSDGTSSRIFRETVRSGPPEREPTLLVVRFQLRFVRRSRVLHALFRAESIANTPLFAGFPGFASKLWLTDVNTGIYRGVYGWNGADQATAYATTLSKLLRLLSVPGSVHFHVEAGTARDDFLRDPGAIGSIRAVDDDIDGAEASAEDAWWRLSTPLAIGAKS
jgi:hypothetical protein